MRLLQEAFKMAEQGLGSRTDNAGSGNRLAKRRANGTGDVQAANLLSKPDTDDKGSVRNMGTVAKADADRLERVELDKSPPRRPVTWNVDDDIDMRLFWAMADVEKLQKDVDVKFKDTKYKGISAGQVVAVTKKVLIENGVKFTPITTKDDIKRSGNKTEIWIVGRFSCVDRPDDYIDRGTWGEGNDNAAHGYQKATTNAEKIILKSILQMTTEGDEDAPVETRSNDDNSRVKDAEALTDAALKSWADNFARALKSCKTQDDLKQVRAENAHMMRNKSVPEVTREYFADTIAQIEGDLS